MFQRLAMVLLLCSLAAQATAKDKLKVKNKDQGKVDVTLTAPAANSSSTAPATLTVAADATASQNNHPVVQVDFFAGTTLIGSASTAPYAITWSNVAAGNYVLTAQATNDKGDSATSEAVPVNVNAPPAVTLTAPATHSSYTGPANITLSAEVTDSDGSIAKVEFFDGTTAIGTATNAPYSIQWTNVAPGNYRITAIATDNQGAATTSSAIAINVNAPPTITLTAPGNNASYIAPTTITLSATAADADGTIASVTFHSGSTVLATVTNAPYQFAWTDATPGTYAITAIATDNQGATTSAVPVTVTVIANQAPSVALTAPLNDQRLTAPASLLINASASDTDGSIAKVAFYANSTLVGTVIDAPYMFHWTNVEVGSYAITAKAIDNLGGQTTSAPVSVTVVANTPPSLQITATASGTTAPATIALAAQATDADGGIAQVAFFHGTTLLATVTQAPYQFSWSDVPAGSYTVTAQATDNAGASTTSAAVSITLAAQAAGPAQVYFIETDHLNTPRRITNKSNQVVWQWQNDDPFGNNVPTASANFEFNLRFPGQYFDRETNLHYNYFRDYDPATGRYIQSDPIGLGGGVNTYLYANGRPVTLSDRLGLWATDAHDYFIDRAFPGLPDAIKDIIKAGSAYADKPEFQGPDYAHMHGMSSESMGPEEARRKMCEFIKGYMGKAEDAKRNGTAHYWFYLGMAMHPVMDSTSPAHEGFQRWHGVRKDGKKHGPWPTSMENINVARQPYHTDRTVQRMKDAVNGNFKDCGC